MSEVANETQALQEEPEKIEPQSSELQKSSEPQENSGREEIKFQRIMEYKAYRRGMKLTRLGIALLLAVALAFTWYISPFFGIVLPIVVIIITAITILASMGNEQTYTVYNTRVVLKRRGDDKRKSVPLNDIVSVKYKSAFYEKRMCVGTVIITAKSDRGKVKKYKMKHILDAKPIVEFISANINGGQGGGQDRE